MFFEFSDRARELQDRVRSFMDRNIYPNEGTFCKQRDEGDRWEPLPSHGGTEKEGPGRRPLEPLPA